MNDDFFNMMFADLSIPVVVCKNIEELPVVYMNIRAELLFSPSYSVDMLKEKKPAHNLNEWLQFQSPQEYEAFRAMLAGTKHIANYTTEIETFDGDVLPVMLTGTVITHNVADDYAVFYAVEKDYDAKEDTAVYSSWSISAIKAALLADGVDESIDMIIGFAGSQLGASRAYVFEEVSETTTRNTYEWCAKGVRPAMQGLQNLKKADYNYDTIIKYGMYITNDVRLLPDEDKEILEAQGIKAVAIITLFVGGKPMGYIGLDDCAHYRTWSGSEIEFLKTVSSLVSLLIMRRNAEQGARRGLDILQLMSDNSDEVVYVNSLDDYTVKFVSRALADALGKKPEELLERKCWEVFMVDQDGPCDFCPISKLKNEDGTYGKESYIWERYNPIINKTYLIKDNIIKWVDGTDMHVETAIDMTQRMEYEEKLRYMASVDAMTGIFNRQQGTKILEEKLQDPSVTGSLCFLDIDGLKYTNDHYGHSVGDGLLIETVRIICENISENDMVCRWGGDEFLLWIAGDAEHAKSIIGKIQEEMDSSNRKNNKPYNLSFSYGIVPFVPGEGTYLDELVTQSDELMYADKMTKRGKMLRRRRTD